VIQLSKFLNHTLATHNQVDSFFENINHNDGKGAFTLTLFEMTITDYVKTKRIFCATVRETSTSRTVGFKKKRELSEKVLSNFIKFLYIVTVKKLRLCVRNTTIKQTQIDIN
jgi:hypothetical protein